jgi:CHAT domain-containing protein/Tfp pilus assembly protein PilF
MHEIQFIPIAQGLCRFRSRRSLLLLMMITVTILTSGAHVFGATVEETAASSMHSGKQALRRGDYPEAAALYKKALAKCDTSDKQCSRIDILLALAQIDHLTGQFRKALAQLEPALHLAKISNDLRRTAAVENGIGNAFLGLGQMEPASFHFTIALDLVNKEETHDLSASILNNLGNFHAAQEHFEKATVSYDEAVKRAEQAKDMLLAATAAINGATIAERNADHARAAHLLAQAIGRLMGIEDSSAKANNLINAGLCYATLHQQSPEEKLFLLAAHAALGEALAVARRLPNQRMISYSSGYLGHLYEEQGQLHQAQEFSRVAIFAAQLQQSTESLYRWHWQEARLLERMGDIDGAIKGYRYAISDLKKIREEMDSCYAAPEWSYQKTAKAVCAELVNLLLRKASKTARQEDAQPWLVEARDTLETLKVFELREYFKDDCLDASRTVTKNLDAISSNIAVFYPVLLPDRVELLVSFSGRLKRITLPVDVATFTKEVRAFRRSLVQKTSNDFLPHAQTLYDWLIRPLEGDLAAQRPETLVFVPDGPLRTIPMAALHDGHQFLVARYQIAVTPGLNMSDPSPVKQDGARILCMGVTQPVQGFPGLPYVADELRDIGDFYSGSVLLDHQFKLANMEQELKKEQFSMIHIASHGQFGGTLGETFLLAFDERLPMNRLAEYVGLFKFREDPLDMLVLSACETAAGDDRAALGLAGVAVRAGAKSALATLWHVYDPVSYELVVEFYRQLSTGKVSRAAALRIAQLKLINNVRYEHPCFWAPFLLINNWL